MRRLFFLWIFESAGLFAILHYVMGVAVKPAALCAPLAVGVAMILGLFEMTRSRR